MTTKEETVPSSQLIAAIHQVQQSIGVIQKSKTADVQKYKYKYADLGSIWRELRPLLAVNGLTVMQPITYKNGVDMLTTKIYHKSGECMTEDMRLILTNDDPQKQGAAITYARRYQLISMLGIVVDDDNDAADHRMADGEMVKEWVRAYMVMVQGNNPDVSPTYNDFITFMQEVYQKHPKYIRATEHNTVLATINAFNTDKTVKE